MSTAAIRKKRQPRTSPSAHSRKSSRLLSWRFERLICLLLLVGVAAWFTGYIVQSSPFRVKRVLFEGVHAVPEHEVLAVAGVTTEDSIMWLDTAAIVDRVEALPYVRRCEVKRMYPNEVLLRIVEREPVATVMASNHLFEIDRENVVLRELSPHAEYIGPMITNLPDVTALEPGVQIENEALTEALALWEAFRDVSFLPEVTLSEISAEHVNKLRMFFDELPYEIRWGRSDYRRQAARLEVLWHELHGDIPCEYYLDLRFDTDLVCK